jgi:hypothetical protein
MEITVNEAVRKVVAYLKADCGVRYWEDATVNGTQDEGGTLIPHREGDVWRPLIDLDTGVVVNWPEGTEASIHYKVCDAGRYALLDHKMDEVLSIDGYVPSIMCPEGGGYGDYVIMNIDSSGKIANWEADLSAFENVPA